MKCLTDEKRTKVAYFISCILMAAAYLRAQDITTGSAAAKMQQQSIPVQQETIVVTGTFTPVPAPELDRLRHRNRGQQGATVLPKLGLTISNSLRLLIFNSALQRTFRETFPFVTRLSDRPSFC